MSIYFADDSKGLSWPELISGTLVTRYKRFLVDVRLENGDIVTAHCPNSGSMKSCCEAGRRVFLSYHDKPKRRLKYTWELIEMPTSLVGVNTQVPNHLVARSIMNRQIQDFIDYGKVLREVRIRENFRIDLVLVDHGGKRCFVEIKNCTLVENQLALFPDAVTARGLKHILELEKLMEAGNRCVMFFLIQRTDSKAFSPAENIDAQYAGRLRTAAGKGLEILAYDVTMDLKRICINHRVPVLL
jgi:sugar fermentation stimulation protein A